MTAPVYLILGATGGIGSALAHQAHASGAAVVLAARDDTRRSSLATSLGAAHTALDALDVTSVEAAIDFAVQTHGRLDGVAHCVGSILLKPAHLTKPEEFDAVVRTNLTSAFAVVRAATRVMQSNSEPSGGSIVLVASAAARLGLANHEAIAAAKGGIIGLTLSAAATYAPRQVRVNCVAPGLVRTPMTARLTSSPAAEQASLAMHALGALGEPDDVATPMLWLLDRTRSGWVTGQVIGIDGGLGSVRSR